jgi:hypothetical protein
MIYYEHLMSTSGAMGEFSENAYLFT